MRDDDKTELVEEAEKLFRHLAVDFLTQNDPDYDISQTYCFENVEEDPLKLMNNVAVSLSFPSYLQPIFSTDSGEILTFKERFIEENEEKGSAQTSMSIRRVPDPKAFQSLKGSSNNVPFSSIGFDKEMDELFSLSNRESEKIEDENEHLDFTECLDVPPGFSKAIKLSDVSIDVLDSAQNVEITENYDSSLVCDIFDALGLQSLKARKGSFETKKVLKAIINTGTLKDDTKETDRVNFLESDNKKLEDTIFSYKADLSMQGAVKQANKQNVLRIESEFVFAQVLDVTNKVPKFEEIKSVLARKYLFELDPFQQQAIISMEEGNSVFVAAHTSAGKTVVAEYAIALCKIHKTRVIYTSPIKALSNQKFRDFKLIFDDVGLVTGDLQLNTDAFCLIMTTEILRSMIYNGSEAIRELEWVIFDEVHYINDEERGYVWEEIIIMLPPHVKIVMLSATVPNCVEFADWVGRIKNRKINVIQTLKRPVPLEHFLYTGKDGKTKKDMFLILNKDGDFLTHNFNKACEAKKNMLAKTFKKNGPPNNQYTHSNDKNIYINLIDHLKSLDLLPMVVFVFSRKRCDFAATMLKSIDLTTAKEKSQIHKFFTKCIDRLKGSDKKLPQLLLMQEHCKRGFAVHHSGILPIIKEVVELLFQKGLVKILFATETFAMGVNMPARTVVFDTIEKFDGNSLRFLNSTEYVQMAGRAGRRGLDSTGTVIIISKGPNLPELLHLINMLSGKPIHLESRFRITYGMILNLLRVEQLRIEDLLQRSFVERNSLRLMSTRKQKMQKLSDEIKCLPVDDCMVCMPKNTNLGSITEYFKTLREYNTKMQMIWPILVNQHGIDKLFNTGRILIINYVPLGLFGRLAVLLKSERHKEGTFSMDLLIVSDREFFTSVPTNMKAFEKFTEEEKKWLIESSLLLHYAVNGLEAVEAYSKSSLFDRHSFYVLENVGLEVLCAICKQSLKIGDPDIILQEFHGRRSIRDRSPTSIIHNIVMQLKWFSTSWSSVPSPSSFIKINEGNSVKPIYLIGKEITKNELNIFKSIKEVRDLRVQLMDSEIYHCQTCPQFQEHLKLFIKRFGLEERRKILKFQTSSDGLLMSRDYEDRLNVLKTLDYVDKNNMTGLKGKVACEINHQELLITELILENKFEGLNCPEIAALLSPLTCKVPNLGKFQKKKSPNLHDQSNVKVVSADPIAPNDSRLRPILGHINIKDSSVENQETIDDQSTITPADLDITDKENVVPKELINGLYESLLEVANRIDSVQESFGVHTSVSNELNNGLMEAIYQWASGMPFSDIMKLTDAQEGIIVRCIQRLVEVLKDVRKAARIVGNPELYERMEQTSATIKRDIVFAVSLYTIEE